MCDLTPELEAEIETLSEKYEKLSRNTDPAPRAEVEAAITRIYERNADAMPAVAKRIKKGMPAVEAFRWYLSPTEMLDAIHGAGFTDLGNFDGIGDLNWLCTLYEADAMLQKVSGEPSIMTAEERQDLDDMLILTKCGYIHMSDTVFIRDNPAEIHVDAQGNMHNESGPAVLWRDGTAEWRIGGHEVTEKIVMHPESITVEEIKSESNAEVRRIMIDRFGLERYVEACGATVLDEDTYFGFPRLLIRLDDRSLWMWGTDSGTGRIYGMPVFDGVSTCAAAHESICGFRESGIVGQS